MPTETVTAPVKSSVKSGKALYHNMRANFDFSLIRWTIRRYNPKITEDQADAMIDAFLQWFALAPLNTPTRYVVMFNTPVEEAFHNFVLNTRLYGKFCEQFLGYFFHHDPLTQENGPEVEPLARYTVDLLQDTYGEELSPLLRDWIQQFHDGTYHVACVGPGGHC